MRLNRSAWITQGFIACCLLASGSVQAQIVPDGTLGNERSQVTSISPNTERIDGGAIRGSNLFHSFQEFSIDEGRGAYFANPIGVENILSRVTGRNPSDILGTLGVLGNANLYLLNPNGIFFGQSAKLDIRGSFTASTADSIVFSDRSLYSVTDTQTRTLLTVAVPIGLQYGAQQVGVISNAGNLAVGQGQKLTLLGGTVTSSGQLTASGGTVQVLGNQVALLDNARIDVSNATGGGTVLVGGDFQGKGEVHNAAQTFVAPGVTINADALTAGNGGRVIIWADDTTRFYGNVSARGGANSGNGGFVEVSGKQNLIFRGKVNTTALNGVTGTLLLDPTVIIIANGNEDSAADGTDTFTGNNSGQVGSVLSNPFNAINDTAPTTLFESELEGLDGNTSVILQATNSITINDLADNFLTFAAGTGSVTFRAGGTISMNSGDTISASGRNIEISGTNLSLGIIDTLSNSGSGGNIRLTATNGDIKTGKLESSSASFAGNAGNGGEVAVNATNGIISIQGFTETINGIVITTAIRSNSFIFDSDPQITGNTSNGGAVSLTASNGININGDIVTQSFNFGIGNSEKAGDVKLNTTNGSINLFGTVAANSATNGNSGVGGAITLTAAKDIFVSGVLASESSASGRSGDGGKVTLKTGGGIIELSGDIVNFSSSRLGVTGVGGEVELNAGSNVTTYGIFAGTDGAGRGGNITLVSQNGFIDTSSRIVSSTSKFGDAGEIVFNAGGRITTNDIFANSEGFGSAGNVSLISRGGAIDTSRGLINASSVFPVSSDPPFGIPFGNGGNVALNAKGDIVSGSIESIGQKGGQIILNSGGNLSVAKNDIVSITTGQGRGGDINLLARSVTLTDARVANLTFGDGRSGDIVVKGSDSINILNQGGFSPTDIGSPLFQILKREAERFEFNGSGIVSTTGSIFGGKTIGNTGDIAVETGRLLIQAAPGARGLTGISTATLKGSGGNGGNITVNAFRSLDIFGNTPEAFEFSPSRQDIANAVINIKTGITSATQGAGNGGAIKITTGDLTVRDTAAITSGVTADATGNGGTLTINANSVELLRKAALGTATLGSGDAGNLTINARQQINLSNGLIASDTLTTRKAGDITIDAGEITLRNRSRIGSATYAGVGGNITLTTRGNVELRGRSEISTEAFTAVSGGNIRIRAGGAIFSPSLADNNDIVATAVNGQGGTIEFEAKGGPLSFRQFNKVRSPESDFSSASLSGANGNVTGVEQNPQPPLPTQPIVRDLPQVCPQGVTTRQAGRSDFRNTGRGGLPPNPSEALESNTAQVPWVTLEPETPTPTRAENSQSSPTSTPEAIEEAQGWARLPNGRVFLTAKTPTTLPNPCLLRSSQP